MTVEKRNPSYLSQKLELRMCANKGGFGLFAREPVEKGEVLALWGGVVVSSDRLAEYSEYAQTHGLQVEDNLFLLPLIEDDPSDYFNHSCSPNSGLNGQICLVAMRAVEVDEELCFDYAMSDSNPYDEFECGCGSENCRDHVTAEDWKRPELQDRYAGYFSPYLQRRIDAMNGQQR
jgi:uncharacterized protein